MKNFIIFFLILSIFIQHNYAQTKNDFYEMVSNAEKSTVTLGRPKKTISKKDFLDNAILFPVFKVEFDKNLKPKFTEDKDYSYIFYDNWLYSYSHKELSVGFGYPNKFSNILKENFNKKIKLIYFTENFFFKPIVNVFIIDELNNFIETDKIKHKTILDYVKYKFGSYKKYENILEVLKIRHQLTIEQAKEATKDNVNLFSYNCPKNKDLILKIFINQLKHAVTDVTDEQIERFINIISFKNNPLEAMYKNHISDVKLDELIEISKKEVAIAKLKIQEANKTIGNLGPYSCEFYVNQINITSDLIEILSNNQFQEYKNYFDSRYPIIETNNKLYTERGDYCKYLVIENIDKTKSRNENSIEFKKNTNKMLEDCGCPFDESIKREAIIR